MLSFLLASALSTEDYDFCFGTDAVCPPSTYRQKDWNEETFRKLRSQAEIRIYYTPHIEVIKLNATTFAAGHSFVIHSDEFSYLCGYFKDGVNLTLTGRVQMILNEPVEFNILSLADKCVCDFRGYYVINTLNVTADMMKSFDFRRAKPKGVNVRTAFPASIEFLQDKVQMRTHGSFYTFYADNYDSLSLQVVEDGKNYSIRICDQSQGFKIVHPYNSDVEVSVVLDEGALMQDGSKIEFFNTKCNLVSLPDVLMPYTYFNGICVFQYSVDVCLSNVWSGFGSCNNIDALITRDTFSSASIQELMDEKPDIVIYVPPSQDGFKMDLTIHDRDGTIYLIGEPTARAELSGSLDNRLVVRRMSLSVSGSYKLISVEDGCINNSKAGELELDILEMDLASASKAPLLPVGTKKQHVFCSLVNSIYFDGSSLEIEDTTIPNYGAHDCIYFIKMDQKIYIEERTLDAYPITINITSCNNIYNTLHIDYGYMQAWIEKHKVTVYYPYRLRCKSEPLFEFIPYGDTSSPTTAPLSPTRSTEPWSDRTTITEKVIITGSGDPSNWYPSIPLFASMCGLLLVVIIVCAVLAVFVFRKKSRVDEYNYTDWIPEAE